VVVGVIVIVIVITYLYWCDCCYYYWFDSIRSDSDSIWFRFDAELVPITQNCESATIRFYFNSNRFDCAPRVTLLLLLLLYQTLVMWDESNWNRKSPGQEVRFDPIRFAFDSISIGCRFGTDSTQFRISFDSILFQFDSIRFAPPVTLLLLLLYISNKYRTSMPPGVLSSVVVALTIFWYKILIPLIDRRIEWKDRVKWYLLCTKHRNSISTLNSHQIIRAASSTSRLIHISN
jgi:hypothetical protein